MNTPLGSPTNAVTAQGPTSPALNAEGSHSLRAGPSSYAWTDRKHLPRPSAPKACGFICAERLPRPRLRSVSVTLPARPPALHPHVPAQVV